jgi:hypothetical protein
MDKIIELIFIDFNKILSYYLLYYSNYIDFLINSTYQYIFFYYIYHKQYLYRFIYMCQN